MNTGLRNWQAARRTEAAERTHEAAAHASHTADWLAATAHERERENRRMLAAAKAAARAKRRAAERQRTPAWADKARIAEVYLEAARLTHETGIPHHVDHEYPLSGELVSGLHVHDNLRAIPARENMAKHNRFEVQ